MFVVNAGLASFSEGHVYTVTNLPRTNITVTLTRVLLSFGQDGKKKQQLHVCHINSSMVVSGNE